jgi:hypothetical protein
MRRTSEPCTSSATSDRPPDGKGSSTPELPVVLTWAGRNDSGSLVRPGSYAIRLVARNPLNADWRDDWPRVKDGKPVPALGSKYHYEPGARWGKARPRKLDNGGVPSGIRFDLRWARRGLYRPSGGYYTHSGKMLIKVGRLAKCEGKYAYTRMWSKVAKRPAGPVGSTWRRAARPCRVMNRQVVAAPLSVVTSRVEPRSRQRGL